MVEGRQGEDGGSRERPRKTKEEEGVDHEHSGMLGRRRTMCSSNESDRDSHTHSREGENVLNQAGNEGTKYREGATRNPKSHL